MSARASCRSIAVTRKSASRRAYERAGPARPRVHIAAPMYTCVCTVHCARERRIYQGIYKHSTGASFGALVSSRRRARVPGNRKWSCLGPLCDAEKNSDACENAWVHRKPPRAECKVQLAPRKFSCDAVEFIHEPTRRPGSLEPSVHTDGANRARYIHLFQSDTLCLRVQ